MTNESIYSILQSKPHNPHYLKRYLKFITSVRSNPVNEYTEEHHICPKASDLFPEFKDLKEHQWNRVYLTFRQHYLAHWLLWKSYKGSQTYAFWSMSAGQANSAQHREKRVLSSRTYSKLKKDFYDESSKNRKGKATYIDPNGNKIYCSTKDPRVLSGELVSSTKGRKIVWSEESKAAGSKQQKRIKWKQFPVRTAKLYFLDIKIEVQYTEDDYAFLPYIDQGWQLNRQTKEYKSKVAILSNKGRNRHQ